MPPVPSRTHRPTRPAPHPTTAPRSVPDGWPRKMRLFTNDHTFDVMLTTILIALIIVLWGGMLALVVQGS